MTVKTVIKPMIVHPYMNSTSSAYAESYKGYMGGKMNMSDLGVHTNIKEVIEKHMHKELENLRAMVDPEITDEDIIEVEPIQDEMLSDEKDAQFLETRDGQFVPIDPALLPTDQNPSEIPHVVRIMQDWEIDHNHIVHNLSSHHSEKTYSVNHPAHHDSNEAIAVVTGSCLLLALFIIILLAVYLKKSDKERFKVHPMISREFMQQEKNMAPKSVKIIKEPLPSNFFSMF
jgi:hypothetical protein